MQKQLIASAKEKGFESHIIGKSVEAKYSNKDFYHLWMCELQKWLREKHNIHISIWYNNLTEKWRVDYIIDILLDEEYYCDKDREQNTYEEALEEGLKEALKLI